MNVDVLLTPTKLFSDMLHFLCHHSYLSPKVSSSLRLRRGERSRSAQACLAHGSLPCLGCSLPDDSPGDEAAVGCHLARSRWPMCCQCHRGGGGFAQARNCDLGKNDKTTLCVFSFNLTCLSLLIPLPCVFGMRVGARKVTRLPSIGQLSSLWHGHRLYDLFYQYLKFISTK